MTQPSIAAEGGGQAETARPADTRCDAIVDLPGPGGHDQPQPQRGVYPGVPPLHRLVEVGTNQIDQESANRLFDGAARLPFAGLRRLRHRDFIFDFAHGTLLSRADHGSTRSDDNPSHQNFRDPLALDRSIASPRHNPAKPPCDPGWHWLWTSGGTGFASAPHNPRQAASRAWVALALPVLPTTPAPRQAALRQHERRESNPQPPVLETGALPVELRSYLPEANPRSGLLSCYWIGHQSGRNSRRDSYSSRSGFQPDVF